MQVNDLIFKELIKRGYSLEGKTRVWNIADSKLWYLTPEQAQGYLDLDSDTSYKKYTGQFQAEDLLRGNAKKILSMIGSEPFNLIDLGCGDGLKAALFVQEVKKLNPEVKLRYCPIDISAHMVAAAKKTFSNLNVDKIIEFQYNISDFDNLENITPLLRNDGFKKNVILLLGNTLGNFEVNEFLYTIRNSMDPNDIFIVDTAVDDHKQNERAEAYRKNKKWNDWMIHIPRGLGLKDEDVEIGVRFQHSRIEVFYTLRKDKKASFQDKNIYFMQGDQMIILVAYKYESEELKTYLKLHFDNVDMILSGDKSKVLGICTVKPAGMLSRLRAFRKNKE